MFGIRHGLFNLNWNIGGLFINDFINLEFYKICKEYNITLPIKSVFGGISSVLHGGRSLYFYQLSPNNVLKSVIDSYNELGIGVNLVCSNYEITKSDLSDTNINDLLSYCNNNKLNGVIISSDILLDYVKTKYSNLKTISSLVRIPYETVLGKTDNIEYYNNLLDKYDTVVINVFRAFDDNFLLQLKDISRIEIIANHVCVKNCPIAKLDYQNVAKLERLKQKYNGQPAPPGDLEFQEIDNAIIEHSKRCSIMYSKNPISGTMLTIPQVKNLSKLGVCNFKLEGRLETADRWICELARWFFNGNGDEYKLVLYLKHKLNLSWDKSNAS